MKIWEKIKVRTENGNLYYYYIFGMLFFKKIRCAEDNKKIEKRKFCFFPKNGIFENIDKTKKMFYLKVNSMQDFCFKCLQQWLDIVEAAGGQYIIICDKAVLEKKILKKCRFHNSEIKFMKSYISPFEKILSVLCCKGWVKAGRAHLTTFLHSKQYGLVDFWNIDADDTMFMATPEQTAKIVSTVQKYAKDNDIKAFSLDMHRTRTRGIHWSFGVTYINNSEDWLEIFAKENNSNWNEQYGDLAKYPNVDWYMTYLKDHTDIKIETFYIENTFFMHWSYVALDFPQAFYFYRNRVLYFPLSISSSTPPPRYI